MNVTFFFSFFVQQQCIINKLNVQNLSHEFFLLLLGERTPGGEVDFLFAAYVRPEPDWLIGLCDVVDIPSKECVGVCGGLSVKGTSPPRGSFSSVFTP